MTGITRPRRRHSQNGVTLLETLVVLAISSIIMLPLLGWGLLAFQEQESVLNRSTDAASIGLLRTYFVSDVASATEGRIGAHTEGADCAGGEGAAAAGTDTLLRLAGDGDEYIVYNTAPSSGGPGQSVWRRECDDSGLKATTEVVDRVAAGSVAASCTPRNGADPPDSDCSQVRLSLVTVDAETVAMSATVRAGRTVGTSWAGGSTGPPGPPLPEPVIVVGPTSVYRGDAVTFDASGSTGEGLTHYWDFGDGSNSTDAVATHSYSALGEFTAIYTATDQNGVPASDFVRITVNNRRPTSVMAAPAGPIDVYRCQDVTFSAVGSNDAGDVPFGGSVVEYVWNYIDGTSETRTSPNPHTHQFRKLSPGGGTVPFNVGVWVRDNDGDLGIGARRDVTVKNRAPANPAVSANGSTQPVTGETPMQVTFVSAVQDLDICATSDEAITYEWDFGDGNTSTPVTHADRFNIVDHTYTTAGVFTARLKITDTGGVDKFSAPLTIDLNGPPQAAFTMSPSTARAGQPLPAGWISNTSTDPDGDPLTADWTFQNGTPGTATGTSPPESGDWNPPSVTFTHNVGGGDTFISATYTVGLTTTDARGATNASNRSITVTGAPYPSGFTRPVTAASVVIGSASAKSATSTSTGAPSPSSTCIRSIWTAMTSSGAVAIAFRNFSGPVAYFDGLPNNILASLNYQARIRSRDSVTGKWGAWSPFIGVESG